MQNRSKSLERDYRVSQVFSGGNEYVSFQNGTTCASVGDAGYSGHFLLCCAEPDDPFGNAGKILRSSSGKAD